MIKYFKLNAKCFCKLWNIFDTMNFRKRPIYNNECKILVINLLSTIMIIMIIYYQIID